MTMGRYRIVKGEAYIGCMPTLIYYVQVRKDGLFCSSWKNIKGFDTYARAKELLNVLNS